MSDQVRWGILGAGTIAKAFALGVEQSETGTLVAVASRNLSKAESFIKEVGATGAQAIGGYDELLTSDAVDAVYIATPHPMHPRWAIRAAEAGKHVMCEKPAALNAAHASAMIDAARANNVFFMEAFKDRCHPQAHKLLELIKDQAIGELRMLRVSFGFGGGDEIDPKSRLFDPALGGGGILDVGCYAANYARLIAGAAAGKPFLNPTLVKAVAHLGETGIDEWSAATFKFETGLVAQVATAVRANLDNSLHLVGAHGSITLPDPWLNSRDQAQNGKIILRKKGEDEQVIDVPADRTSFSYEVGFAERAILAGRTQADTPAMTDQDTIGLMQTLDAWRREIELTYPGESEQGYTEPLNGRPLIPHGETPMTYRELPGLDRPVSRMVMGCDNRDTFSEAAVIWDAWLQCGGNTFDTAYVYGRKRQKLMGQYLKSRGVADEINLICKGAHTPHCNPEGLTRELHESLDDFSLPGIDIYIMHRDNPDIPVGEFVDVLNEHAEAGRIKVFGGSNWSIERFQAANQYAEKNGKRGFSLLNNNLSLARMVSPVWAGCIAASDPESREFLEQTNTPNFSWSSQARGYFLSKDATGMIVGGQNNWDSPDNRKRRERAFELAEKYDVTAINIAAAYVLCQSFPSYALIGPRTLEELRTSLPALKIELSPEELKYLDLRD
jgi:predicted dehydrogenase/aryl-alcohol dehydrogenase-like predicted oxidoreductase